MSIGKIPDNVAIKDILESIDETILLADLEFRVVWMNNTAISTLGPLLKLYGINDDSEVIGKHMDFFHTNPDHQNRMMSTLHKTHRTQITIKDQYIAETVITPYCDKGKEKKGYLLMLLDVTKKAQQDKERERMIDMLSSPIMKIWDHILAIPIIGNLTTERADRLIETILTNCVKERAEYFLLDLSSLSKIDEDSGYYIDKIAKSLRLVGTECLIVGVSPSLALSITKSHYCWNTFSHFQQAINEILKQKNIVLTKL